MRDAANFQAERIWLVQQVNVQFGADLGNDVRAVMVNALPALWPGSEPRLLNRCDELRP